MNHAGQQQFSADKTRIVPAKKNRMPLAKEHPAMKMAKAAFVKYHGGSNATPPAVKKAIGGTRGDLGG